MSAACLSRVKSVVVALAALCAMQFALAGTDEPITLDTPTGAILGSLMRPEGASKTPVVLLIAGSGPDDRDGNSLGTPVHPNTLKLLAAALADAGFASVRFDKRGIGASAKAMAREDDIRFENYVDDAAAWVAKLAADPQFSGVAIVGHSEGSLIGMLAARRGHVSAFVSVSGPARGAADVLRSQLRGKLPPDLVDRSEAILTGLQKGERTDDVPPGLMFIFRPSVQPYVISYFRYVPADVFATLSPPCLIVGGDADIQVAVSEAEGLHAAKPQAELLVVPGMSHTLKLVPPGPDGQKSTYLDPALPLAPAFTQGLVAFLARSMKKPTP